MKKIKYQVFSHTLVYNHKTEKVEQQECFAEFIRDYSEANEEIAKREAYNGEYTIEDDGLPEPEPAPSEGDSAVWDELDAAYQEGVDSV